MAPMRIINVLNPNGFIIDIHSPKHLRVSLFLDSQGISAAFKRNRGMANTNCLHKSTY